jgi:sugar lactone lactonase YvrE
LPPVVVPSPPPSPEVLQVTTIAGTPKTAGLTDGPGAGAAFNSPDALALGPDGNLYVAEEGNRRIRKIDLHDPAFPVTTVAGGGVKVAGVATGPALEVYLRKPTGVAFLPDGRLLIADQEDHCVKVLSSLTGGTVTAYAGSGDDGLQDGPAATARFGWPTELFVTPDGSVYLPDGRFNRIRCITPDLQVKTLAGSGEAYDLKKSGPYVADGPADKAIFSNPHGVAVDAAGVVYALDTGNSQFRKVKDGIVTTLAGSYEGFKDGFWRGARFGSPYGVALDPAGNLIVADTLNHRIRRVTPLGDVVTLAGSGPTATGQPGVAVPAGDHLDGPAANARFNDPRGLAVAADGTIYVADQLNHCIRKLSR